MKVGIIKYNAGNIHSVSHALKRIGVDPIITDDKDCLRSCDKVIFPGVGEARTTMEYLKANGLDQLIVSLKQPVLGICLGMQLLCSYSQEGETPCLGIFDTPVNRFIPKQREKIPHMGWNAIYDLKSPLLSSISEHDYVYFVHSYYVPLCANTIATTHYIDPFSAAIQKDNFFATQFHPEKSGDIGEKILQQFINL